MNKYLKYGIAIAATSFLLTGCGIKSSEYSASAKNVQAIKSYGDTKIGLKQFTSKLPGEHSTLCRLAETITTPNDEPYEKYIENALKEELMMAGLYDENAEIKISGHVEKVEASSMLGDAYWQFIVKVSATNGKSFTVNTKKPHSSAYLAYTACNNLGETFMPSVRQLVTDIVTNPQFKTLLK